MWDFTLLISNLTESSDKMMHASFLGGSRCYRLSFPLSFPAEIFSFILWEQKENNRLEQMIQYSNP